MELTNQYQRVAVYSNDNYYLSQYLGLKDLDISNHVSWFLLWTPSDKILKRADVNKNKLRTAYEQGDDILYELCDKIQAVMTDEEKGDFAGYIAGREPIEAPSWAHMELHKKRLPRQTWLIHFSNQAENITEQGLTRGVEEMDKLALTTWLHENAKKYGGYNFAFVAGDRDSRSAAHSFKYGERAVMFQASGVEVYHYGDEEHQVIFWGKAIDPRTMVYLDSDGQNWSVVPRSGSSMTRNRDTVYQGTFADVVSWVKQHWFQYRNQIFGR